jgi:hypothetical protein
MNFSSGCRYTCNVLGNNTYLPPLHYSLSLKRKGGNHHRRRNASVVVFKPVKHRWAFLAAKECGGQCQGDKADADADATATNDGVVQRDGKTQTG